MTDTRLRELERRWKETLCVEDEAEYLRERVRVGDMTRERLELGAYCGNAAAERALGGSERRRPGDLLQWVHNLRRWGHEPCVLAAAASASDALTAWEARHPGDPRPRAAVAIAYDWLAATADRRPAIALQARRRWADGEAALADWHVERESLGPCRVASLVAQLVYDACAPSNSLELVAERLVALVETLLGRNAPGFRRGWVPTTTEEDRIKATMEGAVAAYALR